MAYLDQPTNPIHLNPAHKGKFTRWALKHGFKNVQEAARHVMANEDKYPPEVVKMANFAKNSRSWNHDTADPDHDTADDEHDYRD